MTSAGQEAVGLTLQPFGQTRSSGSSTTSPSPSSSSERTPERSHGLRSTDECTRRVLLRRLLRSEAGRPSRPRYVPSPIPLPPFSTSKTSAVYPILCADYALLSIPLSSEESSVPTLPPSSPSEPRSPRSETLPDRPPSPRPRTLRRRRLPSPSPPEVPPRSPSSPERATPRPEFKS